VTASTDARNSWTTYCSPVWLAEDHMIKRRMYAVEEKRKVWSGISERGIGGGWKAFLRKVIIPIALSARRARG
jgi:hypothetical protein